MPKTNKYQPPQLLETVQAVESTEFAAMFGSNVNPQWFEGLMKYAGPYLFTASLILSFMKLGIRFYNFFKSPNRTYEDHASLLWNIFHVALVSTAIIGFFAASSLFAIATPALFTAAMATDTLKNIGLFFWSVGKLNSLRSHIEEQLNGPAPQLTLLKYQALRKQYIAKIKEYGIASLIGILITAAVSIIFLLPHVGIGLAALSVVIKLGVAKLILHIPAMIGLLTVGALTGFVIVPTIIKFFDWAWNGLKNKFFSTSSPSQKEEIGAQQSLIQPSNSISPILFPRNNNYSIKNDAELNEALNHDLKFNAQSLHSRFRETIITHIDDKALATKAILTMLEEKITVLASDLRKKSTGSSYYLAEIERPKREQKLHALLLIKQQLNPTEQNTVFPAYKDCFKNYNNVNQFENSQTSLTSVITHIERNLSKVKTSFFVEQSDTQNIIEALKVYVYKFVEPAPSQAANL